MTTIDPSTNLGKLRLRCGDWTDLPWLPDTVYNQVLSDTDDNLTLSAKTCASYILGMLAFRTHRKLGLQAEIWGAEAYANYKDFLLLTVKDPSFADFSPIPYSSTVDFNAIQQFQSDWNKNYYAGTQSQTLATDASNSPNENDLYGPSGGDSSTWDLV